MSTVDEDFVPGVLDLSGADTSTFDAIEPGAYAASVWEASWAQTKGGSESKLPAGTPMLKVQFKLDDRYADQEFTTADGEKSKIGKNRRVFAQYTIPPAGYENESKLKGMFVNFLKGIGYDEKKINSGKFSIDLEDMKARECTVILGRKEYPVGSGMWNNPVNGVKKAGLAGASSGSNGGLL